MGGLLAVTFAAEQPSIVTSLVINDVGAVVPWTGLVAIMGAIMPQGYEQTTLVLHTHSHQLRAIGMWIPAC